MTINVDQAQGKVAVTILGIHGDLDASNYLDVVARAQDAYDAGARYILVDMTDMPFMASSGLVALHSVALLLRGEKPPDPEYGWSAFRAIDRDRDSGLQKQVKFLNPQPKVDQVLEMTGLKEFFEIHTDLETAVASFG